MTGPRVTEMDDGVPYGYPSGNGSWVRDPDFYTVLPENTGDAVGFAGSKWSLAIMILAVCSSVGVTVFSRF